MRLSPLAAVLLTTSPALAGGFYLQEQSPLAVGRAFAGEAAVADSAATVYFNPAGMTRLGRASLELGGQLLFVTARQRDTGSLRGLAGGQGAIPTGGGSGGNPFEQPIAVPVGYGAFRVTDRVWVGLGVSAPFGLKVAYRPGWFGRYDSTYSSLSSSNLQPSLAIKLTDRLSIGAGADIQKLHADLRSALPNVSPLLPDGGLRVEGQDLAFGWNAGALYDAGWARIGAHYRSKIDHRLQGTFTVAGLLGPLAGGNGKLFAVAPISLPDIASVGVVVGGGRLRGLAGAGWYGWSSFDAITVRTASGGTLASSLQRYRDTWSGSLGAEYDISPRLTLRAGGMFDQTPTRDAYRTTRVPDGDRVWASVGASYRLTSYARANLSYAHVFVDSTRTQRTDPLFAGTPAAVSVVTSADTRGQVDVLGGSVSLTF